MSARFLGIATPPEHNHHGVQLRPQRRYHHRDYPAIGRSRNEDNQGADPLPQVVDRSQTAIPDHHHGDEPKGVERADIGDQAGRNGYRAQHGPTHMGRLHRPRREAEAGRGAFEGGTWSEDPSRSGLPQDRSCVDLDRTSPRKFGRRSGRDRHGNINATVGTESKDAGQDGQAGRRTGDQKSRQPSWRCKPCPSVLWPPYDPSSS